MVDDNALVRHEASNITQAILLAVQDRTIDPGRLREFLAVAKDFEGLQLQREAREAEREYNIAFAAMSPKLPTIAKNGRIEYKPGVKPTPYAMWDDIHPACMPILAEHGFAISFDSRTDDNKIFVTIIITHSSGHVERRTFATPAQDQGGSKSPAQAAASAYTLAQRHVFCKAFNILTKGKDLDGAIPGTITEQQAATLDMMLADIEPEKKRAATLARLLTVYAVQSMDAIPANCYAGAVSLLEAARRGRPE